MYILVTKVEQQKHFNRGTEQRAKEIWNMHFIYHFVILSNNNNLGYELLTVYSIFKQLSIKIKATRPTKHRPRSSFCNIQELWKYFIKSNVHGTILWLHYEEFFDNGCTQYKNCIISYNKNITTIANHKYRPNRQQMSSAHAYVVWW